MKDHIISELLKLEKEKEIKILYAVESSSRAWGFASTDSDWDVRFIYIHKPNWYLSIDKKRDTIERMLPNDLDLSGWELQKALRLFRKSNPPLLEWLGSPMIYLEQSSTTEALRKLRKDYFSVKSCMHHYLSMAGGNYREYLKSDLVKVKKYFYVLRPILACKWIARTNTVAPVEFDKLLNAELPDGEVREEIDRLLIKKKAGTEMDREPKIEAINRFLEQEINYYNEAVKKIKKHDIPPTETLNAFFRSALEEVWTQD